MEVGGNKGAGGVGQNFKEGKVGNIGGPSQNRGVKTTLPTMPYNYMNAI